MDKQQLDSIRKMVVSGLYRVALNNGYGSDVFAAFKAEQNRLFDNYRSNTELEEKQNQQNAENGMDRKFTKAELLDAALAMAQTGGLDHKEVYDALRYQLGARYWGYDYQFDAGN